MLDTGHEYSYLPWSDYEKVLKQIGEMEGKTLTNSSGDIYFECDTIFDSSFPNINI